MFLTPSHTHTYVHTSRIKDHFLYIQQEYTPCFVLYIVVSETTDCSQGFGWFLIIQLQQQARNQLPKKSENLENAL